MWREMSSAYATHAAGGGRERRAAGVPLESLDHFVREGRLVAGPVASDWLSGQASLGSQHPLNQDLLDRMALGRRRESRSLPEVGARPSSVVGTRLDDGRHSPQNS